MANKRVADRERAEGLRLEIFLKLFNGRYKTDYVICPPGPENSITDRKAISRAGEWPEMILQHKELKERDTKLFTEKIFWKEVVVFDLNIFKLLTPKLLEIEKKYGTGAKDVVLVLDIGVSEDWMKDYEIPKDFMAQTHFKAIYCFGLPSNIAPGGFLFPLKEIESLGPEVVFIPG